MIAYKRLLASALALSVSFTFGTPTARYNHPLLQARQAGSIGSALPPQCASQCASFVQALDTCAPSGDISQLDVTCFCTSTITSSVNTCTSCISQVDPSEASTSQAIQTDVATICGSSGSVGEGDTSSASDEPDFSTSDSFDPASASDEPNFSTSDSFDPTSSSGAFGPTPSGAGGRSPTSGGSTGSTTGGGINGPGVKTLNAGSQIPLSLSSIIALCFLQVYALI